MNEQQAKQWLIDNGFYTERDMPSGETYLAEATIDVDQGHVDIVVKLSGQKKRTISLEAYLKMQNTWLLATLERVDSNGVSIYDHLGKEAVDALLKHNNVTVEV